jgi:NAD(P)-dependent dehydrogenase (short-subunit alcohol dehydrogenase family)
MAFNFTQLNFTDKVAIVTGGATGIGRATSLLFARHGARVVIGDLNPEGAKIAELIKSDGADALFVKTDVREAEHVKNLVATTVKTYGALHLHSTMPEFSLLGFCVVCHRSGFRGRGRIHRAVTAV